MVPKHLKQVMTNFHVPNVLNPGEPDYWVCKGRNDGIFKASSGYLWLLNKARNWDPTCHGKWIWKACAPAKIQFFLGLVAHQALSINAMRHRRGLATSPLC